MMGKGSTIVDIARAIGVAPSTVSRVLNDAPTAKMVSPATRGRILSTARDLNYVPNLNARRLVTSKTKLIGIAIPWNDEADPGGSTMIDRIFTETLAGIEKVLKIRGYRLLLIFNDAGFQSSKEHVRLFRENAVDGLIVWGARLGQDYWEEAAGSNIVMVNSRHRQDSSIDYVGHDNFSAAYAISSRLIALGRRRIAYLDSYKDLSISAERLSGYRKALSDAGLETAPDLLFKGPSLEAHLEGIARLAAGPDPRIDAVQCLNDGLALECAHCLRSRGIPVPDSVMLAGGDRVVDRYAGFVSWNAPMLSFRTNCVRIGELAATRLLSMIDGDASRGSVALVPFDLVEDLDRAEPMPELNCRRP